MTSSIKQPLSATPTPTTSANELLSHFQELPEQMRQEVFHYLDFLRGRYQQEQQGNPQSMADFLSKQQSQVEAEIENLDLDIDHFGIVNFSHDNLIASDSEIKLTNSVTTPDTKKSMKQVIESSLELKDNSTTSTTSLAVQNNTVLEKSVEAVPIIHNIASDVFDVTEIESLQIDDDFFIDMVEDGNETDFEILPITMANLIETDAVEVDSNVPQSALENNVSMEKDLDLSSEKYAKDAKNMSHQEQINQRIEAERISAKQRFLSWTVENERPKDDLESIWQNLADNSNSVVVKQSPRFDAWYAKHQQLLAFLDRNWAEMGDKNQLSAIELNQVFQELYEDWGDSWELQSNIEEAMEDVKIRFYRWRDENESLMAEIDRNWLEHRDEMTLSNDEHRLAIQRLYDELENSDDEMTNQQLVEKIEAKNRFLAWRKQNEDIL